MAAAHQSERAPLPDMTEQPAGRPIPTNRDALLFTDEVAFLVGLKPRALAALRLRGGGPRFVRLSGRAVRYRRADLDAWINARIVSSTADLGGDGRGLDHD